MKSWTVEDEARRQADLKVESGDWGPGTSKLGKFNNFKFLRRASCYHDYMYGARAIGMLNEPAFETSAIPDRNFRKMALEDAGWNPIKIAAALAAYPIIRAYGSQYWPKPPFDEDEDNIKNEERK